MVQTLNKMVHLKYRRRNVQVKINNKLDRDSNVFIYYKLITGLRKVTNVHFPYLCLLTSQGK